MRHCLNRAARARISPASKPGPSKLLKCAVSQPGIWANLAMLLACSRPRYLNHKSPTSRRDVNVFQNFASLQRADLIRQLFIDKQSIPPSFLTSTHSTCLAGIAFEKKLRIEEVVAVSRYTALSLNPLHSHRVYSMRRLGGGRVSSEDSCNEERNSTI